MIGIFKAFERSSSGKSCGGEVAMVGKPQNDAHKKNKNIDAAKVGNIVGERQILSVRKV
jgi:hypothetical protein